MILPLMLGILLQGGLGQPHSQARNLLDQEYGQDPDLSSLIPGRVSRVFQPFSMHEVRVIWLVLAFLVILLLLLLSYSRVCSWL